MKKYTKFKNELSKMKLLGKKIDKEHEIKRYKRMVLNGEELPENIVYIKEKYDESYFLEKYSDEEISDLIEIRKLKASQTIANALSFFVFLSVITIIIVFIFTIIRLTGA